MNPAVALGKLGEESRRRLTAFLGWKFSWCLASFRILVKFKGTAFWMPRTPLILSFRAFRPAPPVRGWGVIIASGGRLLLRVTGSPFKSPATFVFWHECVPRFNVTGPLRKTIQPLFPGQLLASGAWMAARIYLSDAPKTFAVFHYIDGLLGYGTFTTFPPQAADTAW